MRSKGANQMTHDSARASPCMQSAGGRVGQTGSRLHVNFVQWRNYYGSRGGNGTRARGAEGPRGALGPPYVFLFLNV